MRIYQKDTNQIFRLKLKPTDDHQQMFCVSKIYLVFLQVFNGNYVQRKIYNM
jgi:hypothetical protein